MASWWNLLMGVKTTKCIAFCPSSIFMVEEERVIIYENYYTLHIYYYARDIKDELYKFFLFYKKGKGEPVELEGEANEDEGPQEDTPLLENRGRIGPLIRTGAPFHIGDIVLDIYDSMIYTAGNAFGTHSQRQTIVSEKARVVSSINTYVSS